MKNRNGYVLVYAKDHHRAEKNGIVYEHVLIAEQILGRKLKEKEVVHHIDENRSNNNPDNLMIFATAGDHSAYHKGNKIYEINNVWYAEKRYKKCLYCNKDFLIPKCDSYNKRKYCSYECARKAHRKGLKKYFDVEELQKLLFENNGNFSAVGRLLGISSNALAKRLKVRNLPYHSSDYKTLP